MSTAHRISIYPRQVSAPAVAASHWNETFHPQISRLPAMSGYSREYFDLRRLGVGLLMAIIALPLSMLRRSTPSHPKT